MSRIYDNWERLVAAVLRKEQLWQLCYAHSPSPSICSDDSDFSSSFDLRSPPDDVRFDFSVPGGSSPQRQLLKQAAAKLQSLPHLVFISDFSSAFDLEDVLSASAELLGKGTFGSVYTAALDNGLTIVVKRLKLVSVSEQDFKQSMEIVGNIMHENVVPLRAYYSNKDEKLLLYDYYGTGSASALLHGKTGENLARVDWETRLRIAIGAARGISQIHTQNGGKLVHGNIKATNIFLTPQQYGCISDLGLANTISTAFMQTARCYAPEVKKTQNVSQASDVYSFGIFLFELLTRKSPIQVTDGLMAIDLVKLVNSVKSKEWIAKVFDTDLLNNPSINKQMVKMLEIGISCVAKSPKKRPNMSEVAKNIEDINLMNTSLNLKLVFLESGPEFDLTDMLKADAEILGEGTFGSSYMARLEEGNTITVKRLRHVNATQKEFEQNMKVIGRIKHQNVSELRAYYYSTDDKLLVYNYFDQDSASAMLHGHKGAGRISLDWEDRLKIAVGVAKGIAHIHRLDGSKLVHGNIKTSNIFLNTLRYGCITDVGLGKLVTPIRLSAMPNPEYYAPEVTDTTSVSQASDVYSFGIVLLELLSGKPSKITADDGKVISLVSWIQSVVCVEWTAEIFDVELLRHENDREAMLELLQIALRCVADAPKLRPKMAEVVKILHEIESRSYNYWK